jgi:hypothetical protein
MPAFDPNNPDAAAFTALVEPWLRDRVRCRLHGAQSASLFAQFHYALDSLQYLLSADRTGVTAPTQLRVAQVQCSAPNCRATSATPAASIINCAPGSPTPLWLCRAHYPAFPGLLPPGWTPPPKLDPLA